MGEPVYGSIKNADTYLDTLWDFLQDVEMSANLPSGWAQTNFDAYKNQLIALAESGGTIDQAPLFKELNSIETTPRDMYIERIVRYNKYLKNKLGDFYSFYEKYLSDNPTDMVGAANRAIEVLNNRNAGLNAAYQINVANANKQYLREQEQYRQAKAVGAYGSMVGGWQEAEAEWMKNMPSEYQSLKEEISKQGLTAPMMEYFTPERVYELGREGYTEQARQDWWRAVGGFTDLPQRYEQYTKNVTGTFSQFARQAGWTGADLPPNYYLSPEGRKQYEQMSSLMKSYEQGMKSTATYGEPSGGAVTPWSSWIESQRYMQYPKYGVKPIAEELATDPLRNLAKRFPYLQSWLGLTPSQRGVRLPTTRSVWRT